MSAKEAAVTVDAYDEDSEADVRVTLAVDYINPGYVYLSTGDSDRCIAIPTAAALELAAFVQAEARPAREAAQ